jgi:hypothetical protein
MTEAEAREYQRAEALKYEDRPCSCQACKAAGVDWKPLRFVPEFTADGFDRKVRDPFKDRIVTAGHWAHGAELAGYWRARGEFYAKWTALLGKKTIPELSPPVRAVIDDEDRTGDEAEAS